VEKKKEPMNKYLPVLNWVLTKTTRTCNGEKT
jgi:hypothetical protein